MTGYEWKPDLVFHSVCPRDSNLHALEVPGSRIIVFTAETCPWCRAERADLLVKELERERDEAIKRGERFRTALLWCYRDLSLLARSVLPRSIRRSVTVASCLIAEGER